MTTSSKSLYMYFEGNEDALISSVVNDLFGFLNWTDAMKKERGETLTLFLGLFKGLYLVDVPHKEIHRCFMCNKLDELIHTKYSLIKSGYYTTFCKLSISIGDTYYGLDEEISKTESNPLPEIYSKIQPPFHYINNKSSISEKSIGTEDSIILQKLNSYKNQDKTHDRPITCSFVSVSDVKELMIKQEFKCYVCCDTVITEEWQPNCLYQFTLDRIDNKLAHDKTNVLICCLYCNCYGFKSDDSEVCKYKMCKGGCHQIKRNIFRNRYNISEDELDQLRLN